VPLDPRILLIGTAIVIAGWVGLLLTHFGIVMGFRIFTPILWGAAAGVYAFAFNLRRADIMLGLVAGVSLFFELTIYFNWLGLGSIA
jgi:hypothetical protein